MYFPFRNWSHVFGTHHVSSKLRELRIGVKLTILRIIKFFPPHPLASPYYYSHLIFLCLIFCSCPYYHIFVPRCVIVDDGVGKIWNINEFCFHLDMIWSNFEFFYLIIFNFYLRKSWKSIIDTTLRHSTNPTHPCAALIASFTTSTSTPRGPTSLSGSNSSISTPSHPGMCRGHPRATWPDFAHFFLTEIIRWTSCVPMTQNQEKITELNPGKIHGSIFLAQFFSSLNLRAIPFAPTQ